MELVHSNTALGIIHRQRCIEDHLTRTGHTHYQANEGYCPVTNIIVPEADLKSKEYEEKLLKRTEEIYKTLKNMQGNPYVFEFGNCNDNSWKTAGPVNKKERGAISQVRAGIAISGDIINYISLASHERQGDSFLVNLGTYETMTALQDARKKKRL